MNERWKEFAVQAGVDAEQIISNIICGDDEFFAIGDEFNKLSRETREHICKVIGQNQEKFAMLIIKKCGEIADDHSNDHLRLLAAPIEEYFGVE